MKIKLKSLHLENFKGVKDKTYTFDTLTRISGMNRLGKTTIATAWYWLLFDKDYDLHSNPNIRPDDVEECVPTVTAVLDIDGKEVTIAKMQKRSVSKPNDKGISKVTLTNTYSINEVPKTERDFKAYLEDEGLVFDNFPVCSHPNVFTGQKTADMRKVLFKMASEKSDYDIAAMSKETADVAELLTNYKYEEIEAMKKAEKKKSAEQVDAIPNQIIGLEKAKGDIDVAEQELAVRELESRIAEIDAKIADSGKAVDGLCSESLELQFAINGMYTEANDKLIHERRELENAKYEADKVFNETHRLFSDTTKQIEVNTERINEAEKKRSELGKQYNEELGKAFDSTPYLFNESEWQFDDSSTICKSCGQTLPVDRIEQIKADFEERKAKAKEDANKRLEDAKKVFENKHNARLEEIKADGFEQKHLIDRLKSENESLQTQLEELRKAETEAIGKKNQIEKQLADMPEKPDMSGNTEYQQKKARYDELEKQIAELKDSTSVADTFKEERKAAIAELESAREKIAQASNNVRIDEQIADLQAKQRDYEQTKADAEKILYQLKIISEKKNALLVEEINNHFGIVKWLLFDYQKNGEYKETCRAYILADDGTKKFLGDSMNTGREIEAKLDICNSFQKFFDMYVPIFLDGAESLNACYMPKLDTQLVTLSVSEDRELKVEVK